jgi:hypothetical protein
MSDNMKYWSIINKPPTTALKSIQAGRLKGKSDINPQWRMQAMTETFGPCGTGWKYTIDKLWNEAGDGVQIAAFALVSLYYKEGEHWSEAIPGIGGSMFIEQESKGPHTSDEAYKMAVTDALSVAMKSLGMAAEIYLGNFDGSKYTGPAAGPPPSVNLDPAIVKAFSLASTVDELKVVWDAINVANRHDYSTLKDSAKKRIQG